MDCDGVIEARDLEDAPVVVAQTVGKESLLLAVDTDEQRNQKSYAMMRTFTPLLSVEEELAGPSVSPPRAYRLRFVPETWPQQRCPSAT